MFSFRLESAVLVCLALVACGPVTTRIEGTQPGDCNNGADDDADSLFDCADPGCAGAPVCADAGVMVVLDSGTNDSGTSDAGTSDAGTSDAGTNDAGTDDAGTDSGLDAGDLDSGLPDSGSNDAGADAGLPDAGLPDAGLPDAGLPDAGLPDAGLPDAGLPDAGPPLVFARRFGGSQAEQVAAVAVAPNGVITVVGTFNGAVDFGSGVLSSPVGVPSMFVISLDASGALLFAHAYARAIPTSVAVASNGQIAVAGRFAVQVDFGGGTLTAAGSTDGFLARFSAAGAHVSSRRFGGTAADSANGVAFNASDDVLVTGSFSGSVDFGGGSLTSAGGTDVFIAAWDSSGNFLRGNRFGGPSDDAGKLIAVAPSGNILFAGVSDGSLNLGGGVLNNTTASAGFLAQQSSTGAHLASRFLSSTGQLVPAALDARGTSILLSGLATGAFDVGLGVRTPAGGADAFTISYDAALTAALSVRLDGSAGAEGGGLVARGGDGLPVIAAFHPSTLDLGAGPLVGAGGYLAGLTATNALHWSHTFNAASVDGLAIAPSNDLVLVGSFTGTIDFSSGPLTSAGSTDVFLAVFHPF